METKRPNSRTKSLSPNRMKPSCPQLCLNPLCPRSERQYCLLNDNKQPETNSNHSSCEGWTIDINQVLSMPKKQSDSSSDYFDFLLSPVQSVLTLSHLAKNQWLGQIKSIFQIMQKELNDSITALLDSKFKAIESHIAQITKTADNISFLASSVQKEHWNLRQEKFYQENLLKDLQKVQRYGRLNVFNYEGVSRQMDRVKQSLDQILWGVWDMEAQYIRNERLKDIEQKLVVKNSRRDMNKVEAHERLQQICKSLKVKLTSVQEKSGELYIRCPKCNIIIQSQKEVKHEKKTQCIFLLLEHFYDIHEQDIIQSNNKGNITRHRLSYEEFIRQIVSGKHKQYVIVDRENVNTEKAVGSLDNEIYTLQVIAKTRQNLARGRYLVAQSTGKDAADILSIIVVYDLCRIVGKSKVTLLTNDHFGRTLQPILESIGVKILLSNSLRIEMKAHVESEQMMIEQF